MSWRLYSILIQWKEVWETDFPVSLIMKVFELYDRLLGVVTKTAALLAGLCILATAFMVTYEIIMRGIFHSPTSWVMEISTYFIIAAGFLGMAYTLRRHGHIHVDILTSRLPASMQRVFEVVTTLVEIPLLYVCMTESMDYVTMSYEMNKLSPSILKVPLFIPQTFMVIGFALLFLELIRQLFADLLRYDERRA